MLIPTAMRTLLASASLLALASCASPEASEIRLVDACRTQLPMNVCTDENGTLPNGVHGDFTGN